MLTLSAVTYRIGGRTLIDQASAQIAEGSKVGLVGRNGAGKSTLLDLIRGALHPDDGSIELPRGHRLGFLAQEAPGGEANALETVLSADHARAGLIAEREAGLWLERFLRNYRRTLILVSHDRRFLNAVTTVTLHLQHGKLTAYSGGFDAYLRARTEAAQRLESLARQQSFERQRMQAFVDRFRYKASKARQAQSRLKALARLEPIALPSEEPPARIVFPDPPQLNPPLIALEGAAVGYVPGKPVLSRLDLRLDPDDRIALLGANGNGKTTLA